MAPKRNTDEESTRTLVKDYIKKESSTALEPICNKNCSYDKEKEALITSITNSLSLKLIAGVSIVLLPLVVTFFIYFANMDARIKILEERKQDLTEIKQDLKELKTEFKNWQLQEKDKGKIALKFKDLTNEELP